MIRWMEFWRRFRLLGRRKAVEKGLREEIEFHIDRQVEKNLRAGLSPAEARHQAMLRFGSVEFVKERTRDEFRLVSIEDVARDFRVGGRALARAPGFTIAATLTLALGIGATTAVFSVVNGVLLRPLPYPEQERLIELVHEAPGLGIDELLSSPAMYFGYRDHSRTFEAVGLWDWDGSPVTVTGSGVPESVASVEVTHEVLAMLGANPIVGRGFNESDDLAESAPTVLISFAYWQRHFGGADAVGQTLVVDGIAREVIGVLPRWFRFFDYPADVFYPLRPIRSESVFPSGDGRGIARLKPGVTLGNANADATRVIPLVNEEYGRPGALEQTQFGPKLRWLKDAVIGDVGDALWLVMGTIGLLLLIACANVANLVLVRTQTRRSELATRTALGAGWAAIARVVFVECAILGLLGGTVGVAFAYASLPLLVSLGAADLPQIMTVTVDGAVLLVAAGLSVLATLGFGLIGLFHFVPPGVQLAEPQRGGARWSTEGHGGGRLRSVLLASQVALTLVLLVGAGLMIRTVASLRKVDSGFRDPASIQTFQLSIPAVLVPDPAQTIRVQHEIVDRLAALAGVESAGFSSSTDGLPLDGDGKSTAIFIEGKLPADGAAIREIQFVSPGFFETLGTPLIAGRTFDWNDVDRRDVVLVSENMARAEWGSANAAIGKRIAAASSGPWFDVVGVVKDVHHEGLDLPAPAMVISPARADYIASFVVRSERAGTTTFLQELRNAVWSVNASLNPAGMRTLGEMVDRSIARTSMTLQLLAITGTIALLLGIVGVYGMVSYGISQRRREMGIRLAIGARSDEVRRMFVRRALVPVAFGVAVGLAAAAGLTRMMASQLFGVSPLDPPTHLAVMIILLLAAWLASDLSARRASALDLSEALRRE